MCPLGFSTHEGRPRETPFKSLVLIIWRWNHIFLRPKMTVNDVLIVKKLSELFNFDEWIWTYATQQAVQWSQIWYNFLKVKRAIVFDCMKIFKFCKWYLIIHTINMHHHKLGKSILNFLAGPYSWGVTKMMDTTSWLTWSVKHQLDCPWMWSATLKLIVKHYSYTNIHHCI